MAQLNVFELTNAELSKTLKNESKTTKKGVKRKKIRESKNFGKLSAKRPSKIYANKIRLESLRFVEEAEDAGEVIDYTPDDDVVLVIDPEMDETPETSEEAEAAAEELIGDVVCKCAICGANYVCDCENIEEDLDSEEAECPVCGETGEQIVVGEIAPPDDSYIDDEDDSDNGADDGDDGTVSDGEEIPDEDPDDNPDYAESISKARRRTSMRRESTARNTARRRVGNSATRKRAVRNESNTRTRTSRRTPSSKVYNLDEAVLNRMLTKFAKENYDNVRLVKISGAKCKGSKLTLEGTVITKKGSKRSVKFVCENFKPTAMTQAKFKEIGPFTENAISKGSAFTMNFRVKNNTITPTALQYSYKVKENRDVYAVSGKVMNESVKRPAPARTSGASRNPGKRTGRR